MESNIQMATGKSMEKCLRTAYFVAKEDRPYTAYEAMLDLQERNGIEIGITLHSRWSCTAMVDVVAETMHRSTRNEITTNNKMIAVIIDESIS